MSEKKTYRSWTVAQKLEIVLAGLRGDRSNWVWNWSWAYLITIRGHFTGRCTATGPACPNSPQDDHSYTYFNDHPIAADSVLTIVINAKTGQLDDFAVSDHYPDLAKLGPVTTDYRH